MSNTYISTDPGDVDRWAAERDAVPVREGDGFAIVPAGEAGLDQERLHWDEFHAERDPDTVVVLWRERTGPDGIEVADRGDLLDRAAVDESERREIVSRLDVGETVTVPIDDGTVDPERPTATGERADRDETDPHSSGRTDPEERDVGKIVVAATGDEVGMITAVETDAVYVDPHPGMTERALGKLGWAGADDEDVTVDPARIERITPSVVRLGDEAEEEQFRETTAGH